MNHFQLLVLPSFDEDGPTMYCPVPANISLQEAKLIANKAIAQANLEEMEPGEIDSRLEEFSVQGRICELMEQQGLKVLGYEDIDHSAAWDA